MKELSAHRLSGGRLESVREGPGRFRSWLLTALQHRARDLRDRARAEKRAAAHIHRALLW